MKDRYKLLLSQTDDFAYICDAKGNILFVNKAFEKLTNHKPEEFFRKPFASLFDGENLKTAIDVYTRTLNGERPQYELCFKDTGILCEYKNIPLKDEKGDIIGVMGIARDITKRKQAEEELREKQQLNELLLDSLPHPAMLINKHRVVLAANKIARDVGTKIGDYCWKTFWQSKYLSEENKERAKKNPHAREIKCYFCLAEEALSSLKPLNDPEVHTFDRIWDTYWIPLDKNMFLHYAIDITERKRVEEVLYNRTHDLGERVKGLKCLYGIADLVEKSEASLEEILKGTADLIPPSWQYPEITCSRIIFEDQEYKSKNFKKTIWKQSREINLYSGKVGAVEVYYLEEKPEIDEGPFLKEERYLINAIAERLGRIAERKCAEEALQKAHDNLELRVEERTAELKAEITERKRTEEKSNKTRAEFEAMIQSHPEAVAFADINRKIKLVNPAFTKVFGYKPKEIIGKKTSICYSSKADFEEQGRQRFNLSANEKMKPYNVDYRKKNGEIFPSETIGFPVRDHDGNVLGFLAIIRDITEHKQMEEALQDSEEKYRTLIESSSDCICHIDLDGKFVYMNPGGVKLNELETSEEVIGKDCTLAVKEEYKDLMKDALERARQRKTTSLEYESTNAKGEDLWWESIVGPIKDNKGNVISLIRHSRDITERKHAEDEMKRRLMKYKLVEGSLYLVKEPTPSLSLDAFKDLLKVGYNGFVISRLPEEKFKTLDDAGYVKFLWVSERGGENTLPPNLEEIELKIESLPRKSAVLIERLDYLVFRNGFKKTLSFVQRFSELAYLARHIVILSVDPSTFTKRELRLLEKEAAEVELLLHKARLPEDLLETVRFVYKENNLGVKPSHSDVGLEFGISRPTVSKRIRQLVSSGYLLDVVKGNRKVLEMTERGRILFSD